MKKIIKSLEQKKQKNKFFSILGMDGWDGLFGTGWYG